MHIRVANNFFINKKFHTAEKQSLIAIMFNIKLDTDLKY